MQDHGARSPHGDLHPATDRFEERYARLVASTAAVRALCAADDVATHGPAHVRRAAVRAGAALGAASATVALTSIRAEPLRVAADAGADSGLFAAVNQDRASNGVAPLGFNGTLQSIGESWPYRCGGITVHGRAYDMVQRNYFSHVIAGCGQYVFSMMSAAGVGYRSAGENIGWSSGFGSAGGSVGYINNAFMNSPDHRANILNRNYTSMGVGSDWTPGPWSGAGGSFSNVSMFVELFVQQGSSAPPPAPPPPPHAPPPPPPPAKAPLPPAPSPVFTHNQPAPAQPLPAAAVATPAPPASPAPAPTPTAPAPLDIAPPMPPAPAPQPGVSPPLALQPNGLLSDSVEAVLEGFLLD